MKPNILFLMCDQLRWDALSCTGDWCKTPNIDSIAKDGIIFDKCVTNSPVCVPARVSLATGLYPHNHGLMQNEHYDMPAETNTWMQTIRDAGYRTSLFGKTHLHNHQGDLRDRLYLMHAYGLDDIDEIGGPRASTRVLSNMTELWSKHGYLEGYQEDYKDRYATSPYVVRPSTLPIDYYADVYVGQKANIYLQEYKLDKPWMCWVSFGGPHEPWDAPEPYASEFDHNSMPSARSAPSYDKDQPTGVLNKRIEKAPNPSEIEIQKMRSNYAGNVKLIDDQIGDIINTIKKRGEWENTIVVLTSDHGELNGDAGLVYKETFLDGATRIPMIFKVPGMHMGGHSSAAIELIDLGETLVDLIGEQSSFKHYAVSQKDVIEGKKQKVRDYSICEYNDEYMLLNEQYKIAINKGREVYLLFDIKNDSCESINLAGKEEYKNLEARLKKEIISFIESTS
jgi:arylsulfatase